MVIIRKKHKETAQEKELREKQEQEKSIGIQDQYQARGFELVTWVQDHKTFVSIAITVLVLSGALFSAYVYYQQRASEMASSKFFEAVKELDSIPKIIDENAAENIEKRQKALTLLLEVSQEKRLGVSRLASLYAAHIALENNDAKKSVELYQNALSSLSKSDMLWPLAMIGLGYAQEKDGDPEAALVSFEALIDMKESLGKDLVLWEASRLSNDLKDREKAKKYVARLLEEYPASVYEKNAQRLKKEVMQ